MKERIRERKREKERERERKRQKERERDRKREKERRRKNLRGGGYVCSKRTTRESTTEKIVGTRG